MRVRWEDIDQETYEDMASVLLSQLYPDSQRINGRGGDGGRDVQFDSPEGASIFQLKSFTGRMDKGRRAQVKRSLMRAAKFDPTEWTLVVPIDPTPKELEWFDSLRSSVEFHLTWRGLTWLDSEMSAHPEIYRYFVEDAKAEVIALLTELQKEEAAVDTTVDAVSRVRALHHRLNEIDPHFRYDLATGDAAAREKPPRSVLSVLVDDVCTNVYERYPGALRDRPITLSLQFAFSADEDALKDELLRSLGFGTPVSLPSHVVSRARLNAPGGLGGVLDGAKLQMGPALPLEVERYVIHAEISEDGHTLNSLPLKLDVKSRGDKGLILEGCDQTGWIRVQMTIHIGERRLDFNVSTDPRAVMPSALIPVLKWLTNLNAPRILALRWEDGLNASVVLPASEPLVDEHVLAPVEALDEIQRVTGISFEMPLDLSNDEVHQIFAARELLSGSPVLGTWNSITFDINPTSGSNFTPLLSTNGVPLRIENHEEIALRGHRIPLGRIRTQLASARASDPDALQRAINTGARNIPLELVPGTSAELVRVRL